MSKPLYFLMGIHHHQPVGNFGEVFKMAFEKCYRPVLSTLEKYPFVKISLHHSGPLLDWAEQHEGDYLDRVVKLVKRGQIEILGGGFYEPILPILKPKDALGQIEMMQKFWEKRTGLCPAGMWLAERVWEPSLAALLNDAGIKFTILDDQHFRHAGLTDEILLGYFKTERAGKVVSIFPSDKTLRYIIPFRQPHEVVEHLLHLQEKYPGSAVVYGDDGEKFGVWPGTYDWVIKQGWLEKFFMELKKYQDKIVTATFSEYIKIGAPSGTVYLPTASYSEMLEWAMPAGAILNYEDAKRSIEYAGLWEKAAPFFRGGFWDNFLTKYPESNMMHKRVIHISDKIDAAQAKGLNVPGAREGIYRAQCNCAYWHGLFGGLYLNYLRHALYENMIDADVRVDTALHGTLPFIRAYSNDLDCDGIEEVVLSSKTLNIIIKPSAGGSIAGLDFRPKRFNLMNTLARRFEAYHSPQKNEQRGGNSSIPSIHDLGKDLGELEKILIYDRTCRFAFLDHIFESEPNWAELKNGQINDVHQLDTKTYRVESVRERDNTAGTVLSAEAVSQAGDKFKIQKKYQLKKDGLLKVEYNFIYQGSTPAPPWLATEINFTLLAGSSPDRFYRFRGIKDGDALMNSSHVLDRVDRIEAIDKSFGFTLRIDAPSQKTIIYPVETVSQSEKGFDRIYQGSTVWLAWQPKWSPKGESCFAIEMQIIPNT